MERPGETPRRLIIKETVQVTHIVAVCEEHNSDDANEKTPPREVELILSSNRRPIPVPYTEEP